MIWFPDNMVLLAELREKGEDKSTLDGLKRKYKDKVVLNYGTTYINRSVLSEEQQQKATNLDGYIALAELAGYLSIKRNVFYKRIDFMRKTKSRLFEYMHLSSRYFIKVDEETRWLLENYVPYLVTLEDTNVYKCALIGDLKIGFY